MTERAQDHREFALLGLAALRRARVRAEEIARATGTDLVFVENGRVVHVTPSPLGSAVAEQAAPYGHHKPSGER